MGPFSYLLLLGALASLFVVSCAHTEKATPAAGKEAKTSNSIGTATLEQDGTLVMQLRAEADGKTIGDSLLRYKPGDPNYQKMLQHVGGLKPGETKPVPPWP
jgi:hypothetical protein